MKRIAALLLTGLAACASPTAAPSGAGLCWRMAEVAGQAPTFRIMARDVPNLESCAVLLDGARMMEGQPTSGAYNGYFIFATDDQITSAKARNGARIRVFETEDRQEIRAGLRALMDRRDSQAEPAR